MKPTHAATGVVIDRASWRLLMDEPLYSLRFIDREGTDELAAVVRVEALDWFVGVPRPLSLGLVAWRAPQHVWVVGVGYRLHPGFGNETGGVFHLDPRRRDDAALLRKLAVQDTLTAIFLSRDTGLHYTVPVPLAPDQLHDWRAALARLDTAGTPDRVDDGQTFAAACAAFDARYTLDDILSGRGEDRLL